MTKNVAVAAALAVAYSALTLVMTYPLVLHLGSRVPHDLGDPLLSATILWWNAHRLPLGADWWNGWFFWPATGSLALSDHRLGASLLASPLQWLGVGSLAAYNLTLLATFPACALSAHWLAYTLTRRHDVAAIAGLAYGFNPYRFAHIEHLELLAAFGMPAALAALHTFLADPKPRWLVAFGAALFLQALSCSYYFLFFMVLLALWVVWFVRRDDLHVLGGVAVASLAAVLLISPIALQYMRIHQMYGLTRGLGDIVTLSADVSSIVTASPLSRWWGWTSDLNGGERQLFPGAVTLVIVLASSIAALVSSQKTWRPNRAVAILGLVGCFFALVAFSALRFGPWRIGPLSVGTPYKPFSLAFYAWLAAFLSTGVVRDAYRRKSVFAFYVLAAGALFLFSLGPRGALLHQQFLYEPPYAWLMQFGVFRDSIRVPARFGMLVALALSTAAAVALAKVNAGARARIGLSALIAAAVIADSWITPLPLLDPPAAWPSIPLHGFAASLELPLGDTMGDIAAMYRASLAGVPTVNGNSGYQPPHYRTLALALDSRDETAFAPLTAKGPLLVAIDRTAPDAGARIDWMRKTGIATDLQTTDGFLFLSVRAAPLPKPACGSGRIEIKAVRDFWGPLPAAPLLDGNPSTVWTSGDGQQTGDLLLLDLGTAARPCAVRMSLAARPDRYPNSLSVAASEEGATWRTTFSGKLGGATIESTLAQPRDVALELPLDNQPARYVRLRIEADQPRAPWTVADLAVTTRE